MKYKNHLWYLIIIHFTTHTNTHTHTYIHTHAHTHTRKCTVTHNLLDLPLCRSDLELKEQVSQLMKEEEQISEGYRLGGHYKNVVIIIIIILFYRLGQDGA